MPAVQLVFFYNSYISLRNPLDFSSILFDITVLRSSVKIPDYISSGYFLPHYQGSYSSITNYAKKLLGHTNIATTVTFTPMSCPDYGRGREQNIWPIKNKESTSPKRNSACRNTLNLCRNCTICFSVYVKAWKPWYIWWAILVSNQWPHPCEGCALPLS